MFIIDVSSGAEERVETGSSPDAYARWSRTGDAIIYESGRDGNLEICWTHLETGDTARLTDDPQLDAVIRPSRRPGRIQAGDKTLAPFDSVCRQPRNDHHVTMLYVVLGKLDLPVTALVAVAVAVVATWSSPM